MTSNAVVQQSWFQSTSMTQVFGVLVSLLVLLDGSIACQQKTKGGNSTAVTPQEVSARNDQESLRDPLKLPLVDPQIVVLKSQRRLELYSAAKLVRAYKIGLGLNPVPDKQREGDRATPEGEFYIFTKNPAALFIFRWELAIPTLQTLREV